MVLDLVGHAVEVLGKRRNLIMPGKAGALVESARREGLHVTRKSPDSAKQGNGEHCSRPQR